MRRNQNGFSVVEGLLIFIIIAIIAGVGWYVRDSNKKTNDILNSADKSSSPVARSTINKKETKTEAQYLVVKEWGIKMPLSSPITDAYYVVSTSSQTNGHPNTMWLGLKSLDDKGCAAASANTGGAYPLGALIKVSPDEPDPVSGTPYKQLNPDGVTLGSYYYAYHSGIKGKTCAPQPTLDSIDAAFKAASKEIKTN